MLVVHIMSWYRNDVCGIYLMCGPFTLSVWSQVGELWISGAQVGHGYLMTKQSEAVFRTFPELGPCFRTGDLVKATVNGWELIGRRDTCIKLKGQRIEITEIEGTLLTELSSICSALAVTLHGGQLVAWYTRPQGHGDSAPLDELVQSLFRCVARHLLPKAMQPAVYCPCARLPQTRSGKVSRKELGTWVPQPLGEDTTSLSTEALAIPCITADDISWMARLWRDTLGSLPRGAQTNFFEVGGDSLMALSLCRKVAATVSRVSEAKAGLFGENLDEVRSAR